MDIVVFIIIGWIEIVWFFKSIHYTEDTYHSSKKSNYDTFIFGEIKFKLGMCKPKKD